MSILKPLFDGSQSGLAPRILNIIILPEIGTKTPQCTVNCLSEIEPSSRIFEFSCNLSQDEDFIWAMLVQKANVLMEGILQQPQLWQYPLVFVCHGLSGIIAKRILGVFDERFHEYKDLLDAQAGTAFFSTPHLTESKRNDWSHLNIVLRSCPGFSKWQSQNEIRTVANVCIKFDEAHIENPILSLSESKTTRINEGWRHKRLLAVDQPLAKIGVAHETMEVVDADHLGIFKIYPESDVCEYLKNFFARVHARRMDLGLQSLRKGVQNLSVKGDDDDRDTWASTVYPPCDTAQAGVAGESSNDAANLEITRHVSVDATIGTSEITPQDSAAVAVKDFNKVARGVKLPCQFLGTKVKSSEFSGRDDVLREMDSILTPGLEKTPKATRTFVLSGLGGVGKTQCALEYAITRSDRYDAVLWADADTSPKLDESFSQMSVALGLEQASKAGDRVVSRNLVLRWLSDPAKDTHASTDESDPTSERAKWLLVFDNADDPTILADFLPADRTGAIIVTSRDTSVKRYFPSNGIDLEPLETAAAAKLLRSLAETGDNPDEVEGSLKVAKRMGGLPLAIKLAAAAILREELTFEEFLTLYEAEPMAADVRPISLKPENQYQHTLSTVWALPKTMDPSAHSLLRLLSVLDPDGIDEKLITQSAADNMPVGYPQEQPAFIKARASLLRSSLIKKDKPTAKISIHRLIQDFTRVKMQFDELKTYFTAALQLCMRYWPIPVVSVSYSMATWPASEAVVPHLLFLRSLWKAQPNLVDTQLTKQWLADLTWRVAWYFTERGRPAEDVENLLLSAHEICESEESLRLSDTHSQALFSLSAIYGFENDPGPDLKYAMVNLEIAQGMNKDNKTSQFLGLAYNQVGWANLVNDNWKEAAEACRTSIKVYSEWVEVTERGFRPEFPWGGLAVALSHMGDHQQAAEILLETVKHRERMFGKADTDSIKLGWTMQALGGVRLKQGRLDESFDAYAKALANYKVTSGPRYFRTGQVMMKLGEHCSLRRQFDQAEIYFKQALVVFENRNCYKGECARILHLLGVMSELRGDTDGQSKAYHSSALALYKEVVNGGKLAVFGATLEDVDYDKVVAFWAR